MSNEAFDTSQLILAARSGRAGATDQLLAAYRNYLRMLAQVWVDRTLLGKAEPSDLVQETMIKAHQRFAQFRGVTESELAAWLRKILANRVADEVRRFSSAAREVRRERSLENILGQPIPAVDNLMAASGTSPSRAAERRELGVVLADALAELSADHREVLVLRSLQELDWREVAQQMDRSVDAVRMLWTRALKELRPRFEAKL